MGEGVPHFRSRLTVLLINQTSAVKGVLPPKGRSRSLLSSGRFAGVSVCLPGPNRSHTLPPLRNKASWLWLTMSWLPSFNSSLGNFQTRMSSEGASNLILSIKAIVFLLLFLQRERVSPGIRNTLMISAPVSRLPIADVVKDVFKPLAGDGW